LPRLAAVLMPVLFAVQAAALLMISPASGQVARQAGTLAADTILFSADQATTDPETGEVLAQGNVVMQHDGYRLEADRVRYNDRTGIATASGNVLIVDPDGAALRATRVELKAELRAGVIENALLILKDGSRVAARRGERFADGDSELERAVYSPCTICQDDPSDTPVWQLKAVKIVHDTNSRRLIYEDAFLELFGFPVLYTPFFSHPDPGVERDSGFLVPDIRTREELGVVLELPYHWSISPSQSLTVTPIVTTESSPVLAMEYRKHFGFGVYEFAGSVTHDDQPSEAITGIDDDGFRGHILSRGLFLHDDVWQSDYQIHLASDDTFLRLFDFSEEDTLTSFYRLDGRIDRTQVRLEMLGFQGLRIEDRGGKTAHALPMIDVSHRLKPEILGGRVDARFNAVSLLRTSGADTRRATASVQWSRDFITSMGQKVALDALLRGDVFDVDDADQFDDPLFAGATGTTARGIARLSATFSWPFISHAGGVEQVIEPVLQLAALPGASNSGGLPNEDSRSIELNAGNLFALNRAPGFDIWEAGSRVTYGLKYSLFAGDFGLDAMAGQSLRARELRDIFDDGTGLRGHSSDLIGKIGLSWRELASLSYEVQFDDSSMAARRHEIWASGGGERFNLDFGYLRIDRDLAIPDRVNREEIRFDAWLEAVEDWRLFGGLIYDLGGPDDPVEWETGIFYSQDCCVDIGVTVRKRFTQDRDIEPGTSVIFRIRFRGLG